MAKKSVIERDKKRKLLVEKFLPLRNSLKEKFAFANSFEEKLFYQAKLQKLPPNSSISRIL